MFDVPSKKLLEGGSVEAYLTGAGSQGDDSEQQIGWNLMFLRENLWLWFENLKDFWILLRIFGCVIVDIVDEGQVIDAIILKLCL
jgi:hypothetical protein